MSDGLSGRRLVPSPVFVLCAPRSGSTLLRKILNSHSKIHAPGELSLIEVGVNFRQFPRRLGIQTYTTELAFRGAGLDRRELEYLLWDRILHRELADSGKTTIVHKSPRTLLRWRRVARCWPDARYIFLFRHPMGILTSGRASGWTMVSLNSMRDFYMPYLVLLKEASEALPGLTVRYENLTADPATTCQAVCDHLGLEWEPSMLRYRSDGGDLHASSAGDTSDKMLSGRIQPGRALPHDEVPVPLRAICASLGYPVAESSAEG
jgi:hypothetical protein